jgi:predicted nucleic acid-binding protein
VILLDTSVLSRVFRRRSPGPEEIRLLETLEGLLSGDVEVGPPGIVLQEVLSGIRLERQFKELQGRLLSSFSIVRPTVEDYLEAARLKNRCLAAGVNVSGIDCLIAALAISGSHELFAVDGDFRNIAERSPRLKLYGVAA